MPPTSTPEPTATPIPSVTLHRGINMGNMLEAPNEGEWGLSVQEEYFDLIKEAGFDFVRLPVRWNTHADEATPYRIDPTFFFRIDQVVKWALERDLAIIIDFHHYEEMMTNPQGNKERYIFIWKQVAVHYQDYPVESRSKRSIGNPAREQPNAGCDHWTRQLERVRLDFNPRCSRG